MDACGGNLLQGCGRTSGWLSGLAVLRGSENRLRLCVDGSRCRQRETKRWTCAAARAEGERKSGMMMELEKSVSRAVVNQEPRVKRKVPQQAYGSELLGFAERVAEANGGGERKAEFLSFMVGEDALGHVHYRFARHLERFPEVFLVDGSERHEENGNGNLRAGSVRLTPCLATLEQRTVAVQGVMKVLRNEGLIPGWRDELLPVTVSYEAPPVLLMERAAVYVFGAKMYGVHVNGFVNVDGAKFLWIGQRSDSKPTFPGMLDAIVAGAQPEGVSVMETVIKECDEEAGIPPYLAKKAVATGSVSCEYIIGNTITRNILFCYDLELPEDFTPYNRDGEVQSFYRLPVSEVYDMISHTESFKLNSALVIIDFFIRSGCIAPEQKGYLALLQSLRTGEL